jgi:hypothetical protein
MDDYERIEQIIAAIDDPNTQVATQLFDLLAYLHGQTKASSLWQSACLEYDRQHNVEMIDQ